MGGQRRWNRAAAAAIAVALAASGAQALGGRAQSSTLYKEGLRSYRAGQIDEALTTFRQAEDADPTYPFPTFALARIYQALFEQRVRHYVDAAQAYERLEILLRAIPPASSERALYEAYYFQGLLYLQGGDYPRAIEALQTFLRVRPDFYNLESVHNAIGIALYYLDQYDQAVAAFRRALAANADYAEARFNLRSVFTRLSVYNEAVAIARAGDLETALEKLRRLKEFAPHYLPGRHLEARLLAALGDDASSLAVYGEILAVDGDHPITYGVRLAMAKTLARRGEREPALRLLQDNLRRFPNIGDEKIRAEVTALAASLEGQP